MPRKPEISDNPAELRRRAEASLHEQRKSRPTKERGHPRTNSGFESEADTEKLLQELEVHQIELEMQNAELRAARAELELSLEKYTDLYDFAPVGYLTLDHELAIREINLAGASLLGVDRSLLVNRKFGPFISNADQSALGAFLQKVFATKIRQRCEVTLKAEDGMPLDVSMDAIALISGNSCRVTLTDITERRRAEADQLIINKLESTGILAAGIAHDFNNLFTVILLNLEQALMVAPLGDELAKYLEDAKSTSLLARGLTAQLVMFSKGGAPVRRAMPLYGLIEESIRLALCGSNVRCESHLADDLWHADVDEGQIKQVIRNLILNARDAMPDGGEISVRAENVVLGDHEQPSLPAGNYVRLSVADTGTGIPKDVLPKIFDPYFSTKQGGTQKGMGLGLTICHTVIKKHGGAITVESVVGAGSTFHVYLPEAQTLNREFEPLLPLDATPHVRVLLMDDEPQLRKIIGTTLQRMGHEVELVDDGLSAIEAYKNAKAQARPFDAVILDLLVPGGMGGEETMQSLLRIDPGVKGIVMSGYSNEPVILEYYKYGFEGALTKSFDRDKLNEILSRVLKTDMKP